jgi:hypothetical protein
MGHRAVLGLLFAISAVVCGSTSGGSSHTTGGGGHLVGTWRLVSRVVTLEDGTAVQDPGLGKTPLRLFDLRLQWAHGGTTHET